jgi:hypothetical protein
MVTLSARAQIFRFAGVSICISTLRSANTSDRQQSSGAFTAVFLRKTSVCRPIYQPLMGNIISQM